jgi:hypothetical protein
MRRFFVFLTREVFISLTNDERRTIFIYSSLTAGFAKKVYFNYNKPIDSSV